MIEFRCPSTTFCLHLLSVVEVHFSMVGEIIQICHCVVFLFSIPCFELTVMIVSRILNLLKQSFSSADLKFSKSICDIKMASTYDVCRSIIVDINRLFMSDGRGPIISK